MSPFDFNERNDFSRNPMNRLILWLESRKSIEWARDVQTDPRCYYQGDIHLKKVGRNPEFMEVKIESRDSTTTPHLAIERYSNNQHKTDGGPWSTTATYYTHYYRDGLLVVMMRVRLLMWLNQNLARFKTFEAANTGYTTTGFLVKREEAKRELEQAYHEYRIAA